MSEQTFHKIIGFLREKNTPFELLNHEHVHRSEEAAKIRGNTIEQAAKAIILKTKNKSTKKYEFIQCVLSGHKKIDLKNLKKLLNLDSASLASPDEVLNETECTIGSVPPFGVLFNIKMYIDSSIEEQEFIFFSAGTHHDSIKMKSEDYIKIMDTKTIQISY